MAAQQNRTYRYERKFLVERLDGSQVRLLLRQHPAMFYQNYPPRYVNNFYLDTKNLENYHANVDGVSDRKKIRIRWYGPLFGQINQPVVEIKVKQGLVGTKYSYPFPPFALDENFTHRYFREVLRDADLPLPLKKALGDLDVVLCNRYYRWYYATKDQQFRATLDDELSYYPVKRFRNHFRRQSTDKDQVVLELKYARALDSAAARVAGFFPFIMTKNSKYITGIERVCL